MRGCGAQPQPAFRESAEPVEQEEERDDKASNGCCSLLLQCGDSVPHLLTDRPDGWGGGTGARRQAWGESRSCFKEHHLGWRRCHRVKLWHVHSGRRAACSLTPLTHVTLYELIIFSRTHDVPFPDSRYFFFESRVFFHDSGLVFSWTHTFLFPDSCFKAS